MGLGNGDMTNAVCNNVCQSRWGDEHRATSPASQAARVGGGYGHRATSLLVPSGPKDGRGYEHRATSLLLPCGLGKMVGEYGHWATSPR